MAVTWRGVALTAIVAGAALAGVVFIGSAGLQRSPSTSVLPADAVELALAKGRPTVVEFGATACVACREMKPVLAELARRSGEEVEIVDVDVLKERRYLERYRIQAMPTQVFFDAAGRELSRNIGTISVDDMLARLGQAGSKVAS
jgi:thioredoxin 1